MEVGRSMRVSGPWSRRAVLLWTAGAAGAIGALELLNRRKASQAPDAAQRDAPTPTPRPSIHGFAPPYTPRLRRVIEVAQELARGRGDRAYAQADLLVSVALMPDSGALAVLTRLDVPSERFQAEVEAEVAAARQPGGSVVGNSVQVSPGPTALVTLALMEDEVRVFRHTYVGVEHLPLAMVRTGDGPAYIVLSRLGVSLDRARTALTQWLGGAWTYPPS